MINIFFYIRDLNEIQKLNLQKLKNISIIYRNYKSSFNSNLIINQELIQVGSDRVEIGQVGIDRVGIERVENDLGLEMIWLELIRVGNDSVWN